MFSALAHAGSWEFHPTVVVGCVALAAVYLWVVRFKFDRAAFFFLLGVAIMFFALVSPLDTLGDEALFSAHMAQHILLDMVAPPFFILGIPEPLAAAIVRWPLADAAERILGNPTIAWLLGTFTLYVWHIPALFNATLESEPIHIFEHLTFLATGTIFWWPVFNPLHERRMTPLGSTIYLFVGALANAVLGIVLTLATTPFYAYEPRPAESGLVRILREQWGLNPLADQQLGGSFMWVFGSFIFFWAIMVMVVRWLKQPDTGGSSDVTK